MKLAIIGTGYVGLVSGVCFAEAGRQVVCADIDAAKIASLDRLEPPFYEPGLPQLLAEQVRAGRLSFTSDVQMAIRSADIVVIAVGTPPLPDGDADLSAVMAVADLIGDAMDESPNAGKIVMIKSTVPVGTNAAVRERLRTLASGECFVASVPEFLREGTAIRDTRHADRIVIGMDDDGNPANRRALDKLTALHRPFTDTILCTDPRSAEMIKYAANAFLATKISFINEIANLCDLLGADVTEVAKGVGADRRIGRAFLRAGIGYGGSCFPKDIRALQRTAEKAGGELHILAAVERVNREQPQRLLAKLRGALGSLAGRTVAVWGLSYKPDTDDVRESPARGLIRELIRGGASVRAYDPAAVPAMRAVMSDAPIHWCAEALEAAEGSHAVCLVTEWEEFAAFDLSLLPGVMKLPLLFDGRNVWSRERAEAAGLVYHGIGRPQLVPGTEGR